MMDHQNFGDYTLEQIQEMGNRGEINPQTLRPYKQGKSNGITVEEMMSMEIDELKKRVAWIESRISPPVGAEGHDPSGDGSAWQPVTPKIPTGWVAVGTLAKGPGVFLAHDSILITPDPSIPWGEGYDAILPEEAREGNEYWSVDRWWRSGGGRCHPHDPSYFPWRHRKSPAEPAPGSDAEHPPVGYRLEPAGGSRRPGYICWMLQGFETTHRWQEPKYKYLDAPVPANYVANPIPANERDSQKSELSDKIAESVVQDLQQACYDRDELRATVERLTAENAELVARNENLVLAVIEVLPILMDVREAEKDAGRMTPQEWIKDTLNRWPAGHHVAEGAQHLAAALEEIAELREKVTAAIANEASR